MSENTESGFASTHAPGSNSPTPSIAPIAPEGPLPRWTSAEILKGAPEVLILHEGQTYRLRLTRNGKLILQK